MTLEQNVQQIIGAMALQVAQLQTENQQLHAELARVTNAKPMVEKKKT